MRLRTAVLPLGLALISLNPADVSAQRGVERLPADRRTAERSLERRGRHCRAVERSLVRGIHLVGDV